MGTYLKYSVSLLLVAGVLFIVHDLLLKSMGFAHYWEQTSYTLRGMYLLAAVGSFALLSFVFAAAQALPKQLGFVFLGAMALKVIASYVFIREGLGLFENKFLEFNFLIVFFLFLFFDVFVAFKVVNQVDITA